PRSAWRRLSDAVPAAAFPVRDLGGRGVLGRDPAGYGVVAAASAWADERADPLDGAVGAGEHRVRGRRAAGPAGAGALRRLGVAGAVRARRRALPRHARLLRTACRRRPDASAPGPGARSRGNPLRADAAQPGLRVLGARLLAGVRADDGAVAAHGHDRAAAHRAAEPGLAAGSDGGARGDGSG